MPLKKEAFDRIAAEREAMKTDPRGWAVQPACWFNFDPDGCVYCADIETAYRICHSIFGGGDQMIWKMTAGNPIKWVRVDEDESIDAAMEAAR